LVYITYAQAFGVRAFELATIDVVLYGNQITSKISIKKDVYLNSRKSGKTVSTALTNYKAKII